LITFAYGSTIVNYFDLTDAAKVCTSKQGWWLVENISLAGGLNVDVYQARSLLEECP
jgi:hypothetical protein